MAGKRPGSLDAMPDVKLAASNCARVVLDAYAISLRYALNENKAFNIAVRAWRLHNRSVPPDDAAREVAAILRNEQTSSDHEKSNQLPAYGGNRGSRKSSCVF